MILIGLGANLPSRFGGPEKTLQAAKRALEGRDVQIVKSSSIWLSAPVPVSDQPWFHNAVISVKTDLHALALLKVLHAVEEEFGRVRVERNEARVLDLDLLAYEDDILNVDGFCVPHARMHERAFVLYPLREVVPCWTHPVLKHSLEQMIENLPAGQDILKQEKSAA